MKPATPAPRLLTPPTQQHAAWLIPALAWLLISVVHAEPAGAQVVNNKPLKSTPALTTASAQLASTGMHTRINLQFKDASLRSVMGLLSKLSGLNFVIDKDLDPETKVSVFLQDTTVAEAIRTIALSTQIQQRELAAGTYLIFGDTAEKQFDHRELRIKTYALANTDARNIASALKSVLKVRDMHVDEKLNMLTLRDTPDVLALADRIVQTHDIAEPEVMLEVEVLEVGSSLLRNLGVKWPDTLSLSPLVAKDGGVSLRQIRDISSSTTNVVGAEVALNFRDDVGGIRTLANPRIRARNREKARILIGERLPNINATSTSTGFVAESITYVEVGLKLDVEPQIFVGDEIVIKLGLEVSSVLDSVISKSGSTAYKIGTRNANTVLRLKDGENQILAGLIEKTDRRSAANVPGLSKIPFLGALFGSNFNEDSQTELLLSITPRLVRGFKRLTAEQAEYPGGTGASLRGRQSSSGENNSDTDSASTPAPQERDRDREPVRTPSSSADSSNKTPVR